MLRSATTESHHLANGNPRTPALRVSLNGLWYYAAEVAAGFEVSIAENITTEYKANVLRAFSDYAKRTSNGEKSGHLHEWILKEGELWMRRIKVMEAGHLKVFRIYARKPVEIT